MKIDFKVKGMSEVTKMLNKESWDKAFTATANEMATKSFAKARTQVKKKFNINIKTEGKNKWAFASKDTGKVNVRNGHFHLFKSTKNKPFIIIEVGGKPANLSLFAKNMLSSPLRTKKKKKREDKRAKQSKSLRRVRVEVHKNKVTSLKSAFFASMPTKNSNIRHMGVFQRKGKERTSTGKIRLLEKRVISNQSMFKQVGFEKILQDHVKDNLQKRFMHNFNRKMKGKWK